MLNFVCFTVEETEVSNMVFARLQYYYVSRGTNTQREITIHTQDVCAVEVVTIMSRAVAIFPVSCTLLCWLPYRYSGVQFITSHPF
jgi:hypothetical protein